MKKIIYSPGEPAGIGPDLIVKLASNKSLENFKIPILVVGDPNLFLARSKLLKKKIKIININSITELKGNKKGALQVISVSKCKNIFPGKIHKSNAKYVLDNLNYAIKETISDEDAALVTGPLSKENIIIDPGFGFAKNAQQNFRLLNEFWKLNRMGYPILSGLSRKRFIGEALNGIPAQERALGSVMGHLLSIQQGASIVRVHDVKATSDAIKVWNAMCLAQ